MNNNFITPESLQNTLDRIREINTFVTNITGTAKPNHKEAFNSIINEKAKKFNLDPTLLHAVIKQESNYNPNAVSRAGAMGLMQLMPETAKEMGVKDILNPAENINGGAKYLSSLINKYHGNLGIALAAYNAGPSNVEKYNGVPPFVETKKYVKGIMSNLINN